MKKFFAVLMLAAALILPGLAQAKDAQTSMIDDVVKRGVLRVGFSSFATWRSASPRIWAWNSSLCPRSGPGSSPR